MQESRRQRIGAFGTGPRRTCGRTLFAVGVGRRAGGGAKRCPRTVENSVHVLCVGAHKGCGDRSTHGTCPHFWFRTSTISGSRVGSGAGALRVCAVATRGLDQCDCFGGAREREPPCQSDKLMEGPSGLGGVWNAHPFHGTMRGFIKRARVFGRWDCT